MLSSALAADAQHTAAHNSLAPDRRAFRATFAPGERVCICCSQHAVPAPQHSSTDAGPQTPADRTHAHAGPRTLSVRPSHLAPKGLKEI